MKKLVTLGFTLLFSSINAQQKTTNSNPAPTTTATVNKDVVVYKNALAIGDLETATHALHYIIAANPSGAMYRDTLAVAYLQRGYYRQAQAIAKPLYQEKENDTRAEILAICAKQLNQPTEAIDWYKKLYSSTKNNNFAFEQLQLEYGIKRLAEAKFTAEGLLVSIPADDKTIIIVPKKDNKTTQEVSLIAAVHYVLGNIYFDLDDKVNAQAQFEKAFELDKEYELAQNAIAVLKQLDTKSTKK